MPITQQKEKIILSFIDLGTKWIKFSYCFVGEVLILAAELFLLMPSHSNNCSQQRCSKTIQWLFWDKHGGLIL